MDVLGRLVGKHNNQLHTLIYILYWQNVNLTIQNVSMGIHLNRYLGMYVYWKLFYYVLLSIICFNIISQNHNCNMFDMTKYVCMTYFWISFFFNKNGWKDFFFTSLKFFLCYWVSWMMNNFVLLLLSVTQNTSQLAMCIKRWWSVWYLDYHTYVSHNIQLVWFHL